MKTRAPVLKGGNLTSEGWVIYRPRGGGSSSDNKGPCGWKLRASKVLARAWGEVESEAA
jgi:hypothetical protein